MWYDGGMAIGLDSFGVTFLARDLKQAIVDLEIGGVLLAGDRLLTLNLSGRSRLDLRILLDPTLPLACAGPASKRNTKHEDPPHVQRFEEHLLGTTIVDVSQIDLDRILLLTVETERARLRLYVELIPPFPNVFLTDTNDILIEPLFKTGMRTRRRALSRGKPYVVPEPTAKIHPSDADDTLLEKIGSNADPEILSKQIVGISPFVSREIVTRSKASSLGRALKELLSSYRSASIEPCIFETVPELSPNPPHLGIAWFRPRLDGVSNVRRVGSMNEATCRLLEHYLETTQLERQRAHLARLIGREIKRLEHKLREIPPREAELAKADSYRKLGELLVANLNRVKKGDAKISVIDLYDPDQKAVDIPLEPALSPQENVELYFKKARKARRRAEMADMRRTEITKRITQLGHLLDALKQASISEQHLQGIASRVERKKHGVKQEAKDIDARALSLGIRPRRYVVSGSWTVLVGRSAKENDILTHKYARPSDLFFHARQAQGSHVILKKGKTKTEVSKEAILEAAAIAAYYSKARTSKHVPVSYTEKRYVKKVRKGPPGLVTLLREKVVFVDPTLP